MKLPTPKKYRYVKKGAKTIIGRSLVFIVSTDRKEKD